RAELLPRPAGHHRQHVRAWSLPHGGGGRLRKGRARALGHVRGERDRRRRDPRRVRTDAARLFAGPAPRRPVSAPMLASIVIRTLNEARYLGELLQAIERQDTGPFEVEVVVIDSGSDDGTLEIAQRHGCVITHITREQFSFGRSLNMGCEVARGDILVLISGHCVPTDEHWLRKLCQPIADGKVAYSYGKQVGGPESHFSECRIFSK